MSTYVRKITLESCKAKPVLTELPALLLRVSARVDGFKNETSTFGEFVRFVGAFEAIRPDGAQFVSRNMILPKIVEEQIMLTLPQSLEVKKLSKEDKDARKEAAEGIEISPNSFAFGFDIGAEKDDRANSARGYVYTSNFWVAPTQEFDPLEAVKAKMPLLSAPAPEANVTLPDAVIEGEANAKVEAPTLDTRDTGSKGKKRRA